MIAPLMGVIVMLLLVVILGFGGMRVSSGVLMAGDLVACFRLSCRLGKKAGFFTQFQKATVATERIIAILDSEEEENESSQLIANMRQPIHVEHLHFSYKSGDEVLKDIHFSAPAGKATAIVGPSGSGKTTLFSLLERFYQPQQGAIRLGDESINQFSLSSWHSQIGYVSQESPIIAGTIRDNICFAWFKRQIKNAYSLSYQV